MRGGIPIVIFIIAFALSVFFFLICSYVLSSVTDTLNPIANSTLPTVALQNAYTFFLVGLQRILGVFTVITMIGIIISYALDSHRSEGEEFQYYDQYK